jgi:hypothetical protein
MVDENVVDQVWVTVVATGYGDQPLQRASSGGIGSREPASVAARQADREPAVRRTRERASSLTDLDVPEFVPRG